MNELRIIVLEGDKEQMGREYGMQLKHELHTSLAILKKFFIDENEISLEQMIAKSDEFYSRYPPSYQDFIEAVAIGSNLSLAEVKILNAMEVLRCFIDEGETLGACSFVATLGSNGANILGRNYDYAGMPYREIAKYLVVTILKELGMVPTAFIALPGQIYAPTCVNANSLFLELNNAMPSGGFAVNNNCQSLLINLLIAMQNSKNFVELEANLSSFASDFSLVVNAADSYNLKSFEYSSFNGIKTYLPDKNTSFVSTNFYLHQDWDMPIPTDETTWFGVTRRNNLLLQVESRVNSSQSMMNMLDVKLADGGAKLDYTLYQIVFDTKTQDLYIKRTQEDEKWTHIDLNKLF